MRRTSGEIARGGRGGGPVAQAKAKAALRIGATAALVIFARSADAQQAPIFQPFRVPTPDFLSVYTVLTMKRTRDNEAEILVGVRSTAGHFSFMRWLVDCGQMRFMTLGSASSLEGLKRSTPDNTWIRPLEGWTDQAVVVAVCDRLQSLPPWGSRQGAAAN